MCAILLTVEPQQGVKIETVQPVYLRPRVFFSTPSHMHWPIKSGWHCDTTSQALGLAASA